MKNKLDLYAQPVNFTYHNYYLYPSFCGGIFSLIIEILLIAYLIFLFYDMAQREFPEVSISTHYSDFPEEIKINSDPTYDNPNIERPELGDDKSNTYWYTSFGIRSDGSLLESLGDFDVEMSQVTLTKDLKTERKTLKKSLCTKFGDDFVSESYFNTLQLGKTYCLNDNYVLSGLYGFPESSWLEIKVSGKSCMTDGKKSQFEFYYQSINLDLTNFKEKAYVSNVEESYWDCMEGKTKVAMLTLGQDVAKLNDYFLPRFIVRKYSKRYALTSQGWSEQTKSTKAETTKADTTDTTDTTEAIPLLIIRVSLGRTTTTTERAFEDIFSKLALVGGLSGIVIPIGLIFVISIRNFRMTENMMNDCYYIVDPKIAKIDNFDNFIKKHYLKLISLKPKFKAMKEEIKRNDKDHEKDKMKKLKYDEDLNDDEGIMKSGFTPIEKFFTMKRIEDLYHITNRSSINETNIDNVISQNSSNINKKKYTIYKIMYDSTKHKSLPDFSSSFFEMIYYFIFILCCCKRKKKLFNFSSVPETEKDEKEKIQESTKEGHTSSSELNEKKKNDSEALHEEDEKGNNEAPKDNFSLSEKKFAVYEGASKKLGIDFDLINILKTVEGFDYFTKVIFQENQRDIFYSISKPTISEEGEEKEDMVNSETQEYHDIIDMYKAFIQIMNNPSGELYPFQIKLLEMMGRSPSEINELRSLMKDSEPLIGEEDNLNYDDDNSSDFSDKEVKTKLPNFKDIPQNANENQEIEMSNLNKDEEEKNENQPNEDQDKNEENDDDENVEHEENDKKEPMASQENIKSFGKNDEEL